MQVAKNLDKTGPGYKTPETHGLSKYRKLNFNDEAAITAALHALSGDELERAKEYIRTLVEDESLELTNIEIKRIAIALVALDRGDKWFFEKLEDKEFYETKIELQKFLAAKETMVLESLRKAKRTEKKSKSLFDQLSDEFKTFEIKGTGEVEGVEYVFESKKKAKPKMLHVVVTEDGDKDGSDDDKQSKKSETKEKQEKDEG